MNVSYNVEHSGFVHPFRESYNWGRWIDTIGFFSFFCVEMNNTKGRYCIVFIKCMFFRMFSIFDYFKVIGSIYVWRVRVISLTVDKFDWSWISILCKKGDSIFTSVDKFKLFIDCIINEESILDLVNRFLIFFIECWCNCIIIFEHLLFIRVIFLLTRLLDFRDIFHFDFFGIFLFWFRCLRSWAER